MRLCYPYRLPKNPYNAAIDSQDPQALRSSMKLIFVAVTVLYIPDMNPKP